MHNLLAFFVKYYHWFIFLLLEVISGVMLFSYNSYQGSVWISSANAVAGTVYGWQADVEQFFSLVERSEQLTRRNLFLEQEVSRLRQSLTEATTDSSWFQKWETGRLSQYQLIPAKVVSNSVDRRDNLITIDKGSADGVQIDMGVACGTGLVGVVYLTSDHYSVVIPVLNYQSRISVNIRNCGYFGYLTWNGGSPVVAYVEDVPRHAKFKEGDWVETSGYSSIFPPGITVGKITGIFDSSDGLSYRLKVNLTTDFARLRDVSVITERNFAERMRLQQAVRDSLDILRTRK
jgi:rod shape-determining protein MreC